MVMQKIPPQWEKLLDVLWPVYANDEDRIFNFYPLVYLLIDEGAKASIIERTVVFDPERWEHALYVQAIKIDQVIFSKPDVIGWNNIIDDERRRLNISKDYTDLGRVLESPVDIYINLQRIKPDTWKAWEEMIVLGRKALLQHDTNLVITPASTRRSNRL